MKHTKGEWKISEATSDKTSIVVGKLLVAQAHHGTSHSWAHGIDRTEAEANARLITAAPNLLAACKEAETAILDAMHAGNLSRAYSDCVIEKIEKAIKKANP